MKAIFLDRDETLNHDPGYINNPDIIKLKNGVVEGLTLLRDAGYTFFILTNQSGVNRGKILPEELEAVHDRLLSLLNEHGIHIEKIYFCPHVDEDKCLCRKPLPGLLEQALDEYEIDIPGSYIIGDRLRDIIPGEKYSIKGILAYRKISVDEPVPGNFIYEAEDLLDAARHILKDSG